MKLTKDVNQDYTIQNKHQEFLIIKINFLENNLFIKKFHLKRFFKKETLVCLMNQMLFFKKNQHQKLL